ncbi:MAG: hypothetical protein IH840_06595 [Candidatus Heimdallarchaeota archaeon]|nr:hypothetical protein [Candidatus Heimdallarchaeota archaeon]
MSIMKILLLFLIFVLWLNNTVKAQDDLPVSEEDTLSVKYFIATVMLISGIVSLGGLLLYKFQPDPKLVGRKGISITVGLTLFANSLLIYWNYVGF